MFVSRKGLVPTFANRRGIGSAHRCRWNIRGPQGSGRGEGSCDRTGNGAGRAITDEEDHSLNNHRNNRRRGRGNRQQGGGNQSNRIDSRARGNAPQLLDKYKKLAQDAQHNGDRVQAEYYLQFADHYFRVIADNKARQDEQRGKRSDERDQDDDDSDEDEGENTRRRQPRNTRGRREDANGRDNGRDDANDRDEGESSGDDDDFEPSENPFKRKPRGEGRQTRGEGRQSQAEPRKPRSPRKPKSEATPTSDVGEIDAAALPPSIGASDDAEPPKKKRATRARKKAEPADDGETVQALG
ncbi:DUF4167 domain-containing protein [Pelagerythrobacter marensis]|uniref:DUF4167 domain-containing protein n=1 Tax=Pelagerythrobacter marensis TaxID=543877 RepID=UPI003084043F